MVFGPRQNADLGLTLSADQPYDQPRTAATSRRCYDGVPILKALMPFHLIAR